jgi:hypothetical protein
MGEIQNFGKFRTKSKKQILKFEQKNGRNLNEKWPKFEQIFEIQINYLHKHMHQMKFYFNCKQLLPCEQKIYNKK